MSNDGNLSRRVLSRLAVGAVSCGALLVAAPVASAANYEVLAIMPFSGPAAVSGKAERAGMDAAVKTVNATRLGGKKGINGRRVVVTYRDDASSGAKGTAAAVEELGKKKYDMVMCGINANTALPCSSAIKSYKIPNLIGTSSTDLATKFPHAYLTLQGQTSNADAVLNHARKNKKTKLAVVVGESAASIELMGVLSDRAKQFGIQVTSSTIVPLGTADATPYVQKAMGGGAQALAILGFSTLNPVVIRARGKLGWDAPVYMDPTASPFNYGSVVTAAERKDVFISGFGVTISGHKDTKTRSAKLFRKNVAVYDPKPQLSLIAHMVAYNAIMLARAGAVKAKSNDPAKVSKALGTLKRASQVPGLVGYSTLYTKRGNHSPQIKPSEFTFIRAGNLIDGIQHPAK